MAHAYFALYACLGAHWQGFTENPQISDVYPFLSNLGISGHGPEWLRLIYALEIAASEYLGLGNIDLIWRYSIYQELLIVKAWRERTIKLGRFTIGEDKKYFRKVISGFDAFLGF